MSQIAIFCRTHHPAGYGGFAAVPPYAPRALQDWYRDATRNQPREQYGAHGYVTLLVNCDDDEQVEEVRQRLTKWFQWNERTDLWYGGTFDLVAVVKAWSPVGLRMGSYPVEIDTLPAWRSYGDNRACAMLNAADVLAQPVDETWRT